MDGAKNPNEDTRRLGQQSVIDGTGTILIDNDQATQSDQERNDNLPTQLEGMYMDCWDENDTLSGSGSSKCAPSTFDRAIGALEDIVIRPSFQTLYNAFLDSNYTKFSKEEGQVNQVQNFDIFMHYSSTVGTYLENELKKCVDSFDMEDFVKDLRRKDELMDNEIIEMIFSLMDYTKFNELILDYTATKADDGRLGNLIEAGMKVTKIEKPI